MQDNQIITAQDLNNIAIDLGAVTFSNFDDGEAYAIPELNHITKELVTKGILKTQNECKCTINDNAVTINTGVAVFSDGCKIRIEEPQTIQLSSEELTYIFVEHDNELDRVTLTSDTQLPTNDYVLLATAENGTITDKRSYSVAKVNLTAEGKSYMITLKAKGGQLYNPEKFSVTFPITDTSKVFCSTFTDKSFHTRVSKFSGEITALYNVCEQKEYFPSRYGGAESRDLVWNAKTSTSGNWATQTFEREENNLTYSVETTYSDVEITINIYIFDGIIS